MRTRNRSKAQGSATGGGHGGSDGGSGTASCVSSETREKGVLDYNQLVIGNSRASGANQQITLRFLQDLLSEVTLS